MPDSTIEAASEVLRTARKGAGRVRLDLAKAYADLAKAYEDAGRAGAETGEAISDAAQIAWHEASRRAQDSTRPMRAAVSDHPVVAISAAAAVGALLGVLLTRRY